MLRQLAARLARRRRRLRVDRRSLRALELDELIERHYELNDDGSNRAVTDLLRLILRQSLTDRALAVHLFFDDVDNCTRMLYCLAVPAGRSTVVTQSDVERCAEALRRGEAGALPYKEDDVLRPELADQRWERIWFEMVPPPREVAGRLFKRLAWHAGLRRGDTEGTLHVCCEDGDRSLAVSAPQPDDVRIYLGPERQAIRPKLVRHYHELGLPVPNASGAERARQDLNL